MLRQHRTIRHVIGRRMVQHPDINGEPENIEEVSYNDGSRRFIYPDGEIQHHFPDGTIYSGHVLRPWKKYDIVKLPNDYPLKKLDANSTPVHPRDVEQAIYREAEKGWHHKNPKVIPTPPSTTPLTPMSEQELETIPEEMPEVSPPSLPPKFPGKLSFLDNEPLLEEEEESDSPESGAYGISKLTSDFKKL